MTKIIDWAATVQRVGGNENTAKEIILLFLNELPTLKAQINLAYQTKDQTALHQHLHKLYGSCCFCEVPTLKSVIRHFDDAIKTQPLNTLALLLEEFNRSCDKVIVAGENFNYS